MLTLEVHERYRFGPGRGDYGRLGRFVFAAQQCNIDQCGLRHRRPNSLLGPFFLILVKATLCPHYSLIAVSSGFKMITQENWYMHCCGVASRSRGGSMVSTQLRRGHSSRLIHPPHMRSTSRRCALPNSEARPASRVLPRGLCNLSIDQIDHKKSIHKLKSLRYDFRRS